MSEKVMKDTNKEAKEGLKKNCEHLKENREHIKENCEHMKENREHIKENVHEDMEEKRKMKEEFREEVQKSKAEIKQAVATAIDPNGDSQISLGEILGDMFSIKKDVATLDQIHDTLTGGGKVSGTNMCLLVCAIFIASIGLNMNSTAVIIGAMLISPLMGTIQAMAYGSATGNMPLTVRSAMGFLTQVVISLMTSTIYFALSPISTTTSELLARTNPTIWDVLIATFGGIAGIIGVTRKEKTNVIPGVAIATALMPPLCTCGYSIAHGQWRMLLGAGYLFTVNCYFIFLSAAVILLILGVPRVKGLDAKRIRRFKISVARNTIIMIIPSLIVAYSMVVEANKDDSNVTGFESVISVSALSKEMEVLFPEVTKVTVGEISGLDKNGDEVTKNVIFVTIDETATLNESEMENISNKVADLEENQVSPEKDVISDNSVKKQADEIHPLSDLDMEKGKIKDWLETRYDGYEVIFK